MSTTKMFPEVAKTSNNEQSNVFMLEAFQRNFGIG